MHLCDLQHDLAMDCRLAGAASATPESIRNFLFLLPSGVPEREKNVVLQAAQRMTGAGYVYVAEAGRKDAEDCQEVRHLPLNEHRLPAFGLTTVVVVAHRLELARRAVETYPDAQVFLLHPSPQVAENEGEPPMQSQSSAEPHFAPLHAWLKSGQMAAVRSLAA